MSNQSQQDAPKIDFESRIANSTDSTFIDKLIKTTDVTTLPPQQKYKKRISAANFKPLKVEHQVVLTKELQNEEKVSDKKENLSDWDDSDSEKAAYGYDHTASLI